MNLHRRHFAAVVAVTLSGQLCAVAYEVAIAGRFGTGRHADALALTLTLVIAVANEIVGWITTLFIPHYIEARTEAGPAAAASFVRATSAIVIAGTAALAALLVAAAPPLVGLLAPHLQAAPGVELLRLFSPLLVLLPLSSVLAATLQANDRFVLAGARQLCWYGAAIAAVLVLSKKIGPAAVPVGMVAGIVVFSMLLSGRVFATIDAPSGGPSPRPRLHRLATLLPPLVLASAGNYVNVAFERGIAAHLPEGSLAALTYAFRLLNFPVNLFVLNATAMLFPALAGHAARAETSALASTVRRALRLALVFTVPVAALSIALAEPVVRALLERGAFTAESTRLTATALAYYAPSIVGMAAAHVLIRTYQSLREIWRLVLIGLAVIALNLALMPTLTLLLGFRGLPVASTVNWLALFVALLFGIKRRLPGLDGTAVLASAGRAAGAGVVAIACVWAIRGIGAGAGLPGLLAEAAVGLAAYALVLASVSRDDARLALAVVVPGLVRPAPELMR